MTPRQGPLTSLRVIEMAGKGPGPFCAMVLADLGADVMKVERVPLPHKGDFYKPEGDAMNRGRPSVAIDLKQPEGSATLLRLIESADALIEGYRPGVMERLGLGPDICLARNSRLVYGRVTGWGQKGPYAHLAGHDINYIGANGVLSLIGRKDEAPVPPMNLVGDFGGGGMLLAVGMLAALVEARESGHGQVVDAAMVDGAALLSTVIHGLRGIGYWKSPRGTNLLDTGAPFYDVYETADGRYVTVGAIEPQFYERLISTLGLANDDLFAEQMDRERWPAMKDVVSQTFKSRALADWMRTFEGVDACVGPVLDLDEAARDPHNKSRQAFIEISGIRQPAPAPRFSRTPGAITAPPAQPGEHSRTALIGWGFTTKEIDRLFERRVLVGVGHLEAAEQR